MRSGVDLLSLLEAGADAGHPQLAVLRETTEQMKHAAALPQRIEMQPGIRHRIDQIHGQQTAQTRIDEVVSGDVVQGTALG